MNITKEQLFKVMRDWQQASLDGEMMSRDEADALPLDEHARLSSEYVWDSLVALMDKGAQ